MATAKNVKPTTKNSPAIRTGKARDNGPAEKYEKNGTGVAAERKATGHSMRDPNTLRADEVMPGGMSAMTVSIGNKTRGPKTDGIETRGNGAATKGRISRGPMA
jgi:hypothetical protein